MRNKVTLLVIVLVLLSLLSACSGVQAPVDVNATSVASTVRALVPATPTPDVVAASVAATIQALTPQAEETEAPAEPTTEISSTPTSTPTVVLAALQLQTANDMRAFGKVIGWVSGGIKGEFVQGAQVSLNEDFVLKMLPTGSIFEFECVQYLSLGGKISAHPVCEGAMVRLDTNSVVSKGSIGTLWLTNAVLGSATEKWEEGFLNLPCECADGDCRDQ